MQRALPTGGDQGGIGRQVAADRVDPRASAQRAPGASPNESGGRMVTIRFASIVFPEPGGPTRTHLGQNTALLTFCLGR
jgi:hypothetical protein